MSSMPASRDIRIVQRQLANACACFWAGYGYWYWFSRGAPDGLAKTA